MVRRGIQTLPGGNTIIDINALAGPETEPAPELLQVGCRLTFQASAFALLRMRDANIRMLHGGCRMTRHDPSSSLAGVVRGGSAVPTPTHLAFVILSVYRGVILRSTGNRNCPRDVHFLRASLFERSNPGGGDAITIRRGSSAKHWGQSGVLFQPAVCQ